MQDEVFGNTSEAEDTTDTESLQPPPLTQPSKRSKTYHIQEPQEDIRNGLSDDEQELGDQIFGTQPEADNQEQCEDDLEDQLEEEDQEGNDGSQAGEVGHNEEENDEGNNKDDHKKGITLNNGVCFF